MRWIPIVHNDTHTVGAVRLDGDRALDVHWVGKAGYAVSPESWQSLVAALVPLHRGSGEGWMLRACQEAVRGMDGTVFEAVRVEQPTEPPADPRAAQLAQLRQSDPEGAKLVERTLEVENQLLERFTELRSTYASEVALATAIERGLSEYDRAVLATAFADEDLWAWCQMLAKRWWETVPTIRAQD